MTTQYDSRRFFRELALLGLVALGATLLFTQIVYPALGWPVDGPVPGRSIFLAAVILLLAKDHADGLSGIGLKWGAHKWLIPIFGIAIVAVNLLALSPIKDAIATAFNLPESDIGPLAAIHGDLSLYFVWLAIVWTAAAFAEEIIFRGFLLNRIAEILGKTWGAWLAAVFCQAVIFAIGHAYQGIGGMLRIGVGAIFSGLFFLLFRRSLWPLIIAHGVWDTLGLTLIYLNGTPSTE